MIGLPKERHSIYKFLDNPKVYNFFHSFGGKRFLLTIQKGVKECLEDRSYQNVLDVGCGTANYRDSFKGQYYGIDLNKNYLKQAEDRWDGEFICGDVTKMPFKDGKFDVVFTMGVIHHLEPDIRDKMFDEMWRVCKQGGCLLITDALIPSNKFNIIGYIIAKLDRGRYRVRFDKFQKIVRGHFSKNGQIVFKNYKLPLFDVGFSIIKKI